jgi:putative ABC transport system substrate-binding protein
MRRREFITLVGGAATWPLAARAQQKGKTIRIGFIGASLNNPSMAAQYQSFLAELRERGFNEGQNIAIDYKRIDDPHGPFAAAAELMRSNVDLIVATGPEVALQAVIGASRSIPIVFVEVQYDPIARGYVNSLAHPGGNILSPARTGREAARNSSPNFSGEIAIGCSL